MTIQGTCFKKTRETCTVCLDCIYVDGLHISPSPRALSASQTLRNKNDVCQVHTFLHQGHEQIWKNTSKGYPSGCLYFGGGAPRGTFGAPVFFLKRTVDPKGPKGDPKVTKLSPKVVPKCSKRTPNCQNLDPEQMYLEIAL